MSHIYWQSDLPRRRGRSQLCGLGRLWSQRRTNDLQGYSGHGVDTTHIKGEDMANAIAGSMEKFDLFANIRHHRIPGSQWLGKQMIALGTLYYRLRDIL